MAKIFVGSVKQVTTKYGELTKLGFNMAHLELLTSHVNASGWVNVDLKVSQTTGKQYMEIDLYQTPPKEESTEPEFVITDEPEENMNFEDL